jgi:CHAT domain-containing protein
MDLLFDTIAHLDSSTLRRTWLLDHHPIADHTFIQHLQDEAYRLERDDRRKAQFIAQFIADAAELWDDRQTLAAALRVAAQALRTAEPLTALHKYEEAIRLYRALGMETLATEAAIGQVATMRALGRYADALATNRWVIDEFRTQGEHFGLGRALLNQGLLCYYLGEFQQARTHYAEAHALFDLLGQGEWCAAVESNDANVLEELNEYSAAEAKYRRARAFYVAAGMTNAVARVDHNLAYLHFSLGDYQQALHLFGRARDQFAVQESAIDMAFIDLYRAEIYAIFNLWRKAIDLARQARSVFERAQMPWETAQLLLAEATALFHLQKSELALEQLGYARRLLAQSGFTHWLALVDLYESFIHLRAGAYDAAVHTAQQAHARFQQVGLARRMGQCETVLGEVALARGQVHVAAQHFSKAQDYVGAYGSPTVTYRYHFGLAQVYQLQGNVGAAEAHYQQAVAAIEELQANIGAEDYKLAFLGDKLAVYEQFIQFCLEQKAPHYYQIAFTILEQAKLSSLHFLAQPSAVASHLMDQGNADPQRAADLAQIHQLRRELNRYYTQFHTPDAAFSSNEDVARLHAAIVRCEQRLSSLVDGQRRLDFAETRQNSLPQTSLATLQATIPSGTILLEYFFADERLTIFCIERQRFAVHRVHYSLDHLQDLIQQFHFQISKFHLGARFRERHRRLLQSSIDAVLQQFYQLLIGPIAGLLENVEHIVVVPHQLLHNLPFHALYDGKHYLLESHGVSYGLSAMFQHTIQHRSLPAAFAAPLILGLNDNLIEQAEGEAAAVAQIFPTADLYCGAAATAEHLLQNAHPRAFIHLATHGVFRADNPAFSALKLADGWLTLQDLAGLQSSAPLITLSACNTGRSEKILADPLADFYRTLFRTGAQSLVVSLWSLDDQAAIHTMTLFYQELAQGQPVYQALRKAQLAMMRRWRHPYYWAPFVLMGDPNLNHMQTAGNPATATPNTIIELHP